MDPPELSIMYHWYGLIFLLFLVPGLMLDTEYSFHYLIVAEYGKGQSRYTTWQSNSGSADDNQSGDI